MLLFLIFCAVIPIFLLLRLVHTPYTLYLPCHALHSKSGCLQMTESLKNRSKIWLWHVLIKKAKQLKLAPPNKCDYCVGMGVVGKIKREKNVTLNQWNRQSILLWI